MLKFLANLIFPTKTNGYQAFLARPAQTAGLVALLLTLTLITGISPTTYILGTTDDLSPEQILIAINLERLENHMAPLQTNTKLQAAAKAKAEDILDKQYWDHISPSNTAPWDFMDAAGYAYFNAGENLAKDYSTTAAVTGAWMASAGHRANILSSEYSETGIAVVHGTFENHKNSIIIVQLFAAPLPENLTAPKEPSRAFRLPPPLTNPDAFLSPFAHYPLWLARAMIGAVVIVGIALIIDIRWSRRLRAAKTPPSRHWQR